MCVLVHTTFFTCLIHKWVYQIVEHLGKPPFLSQLWLCYFELKIFTSSLLFFVHYLMRLTTFEFRHMTNILKPKYVRSHERIRNVFFKLVIQMCNVITRMNRIIFKDFFITYLSYKSYHYKYYLSYEYVKFIISQILFNVIEETTQIWANNDNDQNSWFVFFSLFTHPQSIHHQNTAMVLL